MRTALEIQPTIIHNELYTVFSDKAPSFTTVVRCSKWLHDGREEIEDEVRPGRSISKTRSESIEQIQSIMHYDQYVPIEELEGETDLSHVLKKRISTELKKVLHLGTP